MNDVYVADLLDVLEDFDPDEAGSIAKVEVAQMALRFAIGILERVVAETDDRHAEAYCVDHLKIMAGDDHGFLSREFNLDRWIAQLEGGEDEE
ncbi:MAG: hypothetical protein WED34_22095 [Planctomycetales bacterium]